MVKKILQYPEISQSRIIYGSYTVRVGRDHMWLYIIFTEDNMLISRDNLMFKLLGGGQTDQWPPPKKTAWCL